MRLDDLRPAAGESALRRFLPLALPRRSDAALFFGFDVPAAPLQAYIADAAIPELTLFHFVLAAALRTLVERPQLNRTVIGGRIFDRSTLALTFSVKKGKRDGSRIVSTKVVFEPTDTLLDVHRKVNEAVRRSRDPDHVTSTEHELEWALKFPRPLVRGALRGLGVLDRLGVLPERFQADDPSRTSAFVANLGSIGLDASFHHLSNVGTASIHVTVGKIKPAVGVSTDGQPCVRDVFTVRVTIDDRIVDGFYCAKSLVRLQHWLEHPEALAEPWPTRQDLPVALLWKWARETPERPAYWLRSSTESAWFPTTWSAFLVEVRAAARAFIELGVEPGDRVCIQASNRPEWTVSYLAAQAIGAIPSGLHEDLSPEDLALALRIAAPKLVVLETEGLVTTVEGLVPATVVTLEREGDLALGWSGLHALGLAHDDGEVERRLAAIDPQQPGVAVFTSGTSGEPKAALLSHASLLWTARTALGVLGTTADDRTISYLPLSHVAEQNFTIVGALVQGASVAYAPSRAQVLETLREVRPTVFFGVPQIWERLRRDHAGDWASIGLDKVRVAVSGAGALREELFGWYRERGIELLQTYGQTEGCGPTTLTPPGAARPGTCGPALPGVDLKLDAGEVLFRGPNGFLHYLGQPGSAPVDGWVRSGDLGRTSDGHLVITGRRKALLVPDSGENIAPEPIEHALEAHPLLERAVVIGSGRPHLAALLTLDPDEAVRLLEANGIGPTPEPHHHGVIQAELQRVIQGFNATAKRSHQLHRWAVLPGALTPETGELTPTLKLRRAAIEKRWASRIDALYAGSGSWQRPKPPSQTGFDAEVAPHAAWDELFRLRHEVFADAGHLEAGHFTEGRLQDRFDALSVHFALRDTEGALAGTARLIPATTGSLPVEALFAFEPIGIPRNQIGEIGRLAMSRAWRTRRAAVVTLINATLEHARCLGLTHVYAFVPARSMRLYSALGLPLWEVELLPLGPEHHEARRGMRPYFELQDPRVVLFTDAGVR